MCCDMCVYVLNLCVANIPTILLFPIPKVAWRIFRGWPDWPIFFNMDCIMLIVFYFTILLMAIKKPHTSLPVIWVYTVYGFLSHFCFKSYYTILHVLIFWQYSVRNLLTKMEASTRSVSTLRSEWFALAQGSSSCGSSARRWWSRARGGWRPARRRRTPSARCSWWPSACRTSPTSSSLEPR